MSLRNSMRVHAPGGSPGPDAGSLGSESLIHYALGASDTNVDIWSKNAPYKFRVVDLYGYMNAAGGAGDKVKLQRGDGAASESFTDISDDLDVSAKSDKDRVDFASLDDAEWSIDKGESLRIVSTSGARVDVYIRIVPEL